jgi:ABC-type sugar transport system ATPase subunit
MITHDVDSVKAVADHVVVLNLGRVVFDGPADSVDTGQMIHLMAGYGV